MFVNLIGPDTIMFSVLQDQKPISQGWVGEEAAPAQTKNKRVADTKRAAAKASAKPKLETVPGSEAAVCDKVVEPLFEDLEAHRVP